MADTEKMAARAEFEDVPIAKEKVKHEQTMEQIKDVALHHLEHISEKRLLLKCDLHIVPILFLLFLCAFIDRYD